MRLNSNLISSLTSNYEHSLALTKERNINSTCTTAVIIWGPPSPPPTAMIGNPVDPSIKMVGVFEDCGRFPGLI